MTIAITGATGFLGLRLLPLLMARRAPVVVLAHSGTEPALDRILRHLLASGTAITPERQLTIVPIDLTRPRLGLPQWQYQALARQLTEIWHCAASIDIGAPAKIVRPVNVAGTRAMLELAAAGNPMVYHVSTAFVAGRRRNGLVREDDLDRSYGFENPYEESKFDGELAVHEWSQRLNRPALIYRTSVLATDTPPPPGGALHPFLMFFKVADQMGPLLLPERHGRDRLLLRVAADPEAHMNIIPVDLAARLMVSLAERVPQNGVSTAHITYPHDVTVATLFTLFEHRYPVKLELVAMEPKEPTPLESLLFAQAGRFRPYWFHYREYDRGVLRTTGLDPTDAPPLDTSYLLRGI